MDSVDFVPSCDYVGGESDFDAVGFEGGLRGLDDQIVQFRGGIVASPNGVGGALFVKDFDFDNGAGAAGFTDANFFGVHGFWIFQIQPFNTSIGSF